MAGRDPAHSGSLDGPPAPYRISWTATVDGGPVSGPVVAGEAVIVVGGRSVAALAPESGATLWEWARSEGPAGPPAVAGDLVVYASGDGATAAMVGRRLQDGREVWRAPTGSSVPGPPTVADGSVYVGTRDGMVIALDAGTGAERWRFEADGAVETAPTVADGLVVVASHDLSSGRATVYALDAEEGARGGPPTWRFTPEVVPSAFPSSVAASEGTAYVGTSDGKIWALDLDTGAQRWEAASREVFDPRQVPAGTPRALVIPDRLHLYRLDPGTGRERWLFRLADLRTLGADRVNTLSASSPAISGEAVLIGDAAGQVSAVDLESGRRIWKRDVGTGSIGAVAVSADRIVLALQGRDGSVVALEHDPNGTLLDEVSPTVLFPLPALLNFSAAVVLVGGALLGLFRYALRGRGPGEPKESRE